MRRPKKVKVRALKRVLQIAAYKGMHGPALLADGRFKCPIDEIQSVEMQQVLGRWPDEVRRQLNIPDKPREILLPETLAEGGRQPQGLPARGTLGLKLPKNLSKNSVADRQPELLFSFDAGQISN